MNALLDGTAGVADRAALCRFLPPLPAGAAASVHHAVAARRRRLIEDHRDETTSASGLAALARAVWALEPRSGGGFGHGLTVTGRVA